MKDGGLLRVTNTFAETVPIKKPRDHGREGHSQAKGKRGDDKQLDDGKVRQHN